MKEMKRGEIYFTDLNPTKGSEQGGVRPILVIQNDGGNRFSPTIIVAAITSNPDKASLPTHIDIQVKGLAKSSIVLLEQIRTIDKCRLLGYIGKVDNQTMNQLIRHLE